MENPYMETHRALILFLIFGNVIVLKALKNFINLMAQHVIIYNTHALQLTARILRPADSLTSSLHGTAIFVEERIRHDTSCKG